MVVNGKTYKSTMIPFAAQLNDDQIANVLTYSRNAWGNSGDAVKPEEVSRIRAEAPAAASPGAEFE
jgi:nitrite reductase (NO-forming)